MKRRTYYFSGRVQGVGFRYTARHAAAGHAVAGFVRNLPDGRVELVMEGSVSEMDLVLEEIQSQLGGYIKTMTCDESDVSGEFKDFSIRH